MWKSLFFRKNYPTILNSQFFPQGPSAILNSRQAFTLLEIMPVLAVTAILVMITILALNPSRQYEKARNLERQTETALLADAIMTYANTDDRSLLLSIPLSPASPVEACGDTVTGSCNHLFNLSVLLDRNLLPEVPLDPLSEDPDYPNEHSRYFLRRSSANHVTVSAPDTEPSGAPEIAATR